jgi:hypothetical protein
LKKIEWAIFNEWKGSLGHSPMQGKKTKTRVSKSHDLDVFSQALERYTKKVVAPRRLVPATTTVLVPTGASDEHKAFVEVISKSLKVREVDGLQEGVSLVFPATGLAVVVLDYTTTQRWSTTDRMHFDTLLLLSRQYDLYSACQRVDAISKSFARVEVLVLNDLLLHQFISLHCFALPNVMFAACHGIQEVAQCIRIIGETQSLLKSQVRQQIASEFQTTCTVPTATSSVLQDSIWTAIGVNEEAHYNLRPTDLLDVLSGRASAEICQEHFGWSPQLTATVLHNVHNDSLVDQ